MSFFHHKVPEEKNTEKVVVKLLTGIKETKMRSLKAMNGISGSFAVLVSTIFDKKVFRDAIYNWGVSQQGAPFVYKKRNHNVIKFVECNKDLFYGEIDKIMSDEFVKKCTAEIMKKHPEIMDITVRNIIKEHLANEVSDLISDSDYWSNASKAGEIRAAIKSDHDKRMIAKVLSE